MGTKLQAALDDFDSQENLGAMLDAMEEATTLPQCIAYLSAYRQSLHRQHGPDKGDEILNSNVGSMYERYEMPERWLDAADAILEVREATEAEKAAGANTRFGIGMHLDDAARDLAKQANESGEQKRAEFNELLLVADPGMTGSQVAALFHRQSRVGARKRRVQERIRAAAPDLYSALKAVALGELHGWTADILDGQLIDVTITAGEFRKVLAALRSAQGE